MISGKWYLDRGEFSFEGSSFWISHSSLVSLVKYRGRDKVRLIRRLKRVNEQLSLLHRCDPEPGALRFHETLRFLKYIKKPGNHHQRFESTPKEFPRDFELFLFLSSGRITENSYSIIAANSSSSRRRGKRKGVERKSKYSFDYFAS